MSNIELGRVRIDHPRLVAGAVVALLLVVAAMVGSLAVR